MQYTTPRLLTTQSYEAQETSAIPKETLQSAQRYHRNFDNYRSEKMQASIPDESSFIRLNFYNALESEGIPRRCCPNLRWCDANSNTNVTERARKYFPWFSFISTAEQCYTLSITWRRSHLGRSWANWSIEDVSLSATKVFKWSSVKAMKTHSCYSSKTRQYSSHIANKDTKTKFTENGNISFCAFTSTI